MAAAFQLVLKAEEDEDLPVSYMQKLIELTYLFRERDARLSWPIFHEALKIQ